MRKVFYVHADTMALTIVLWLCSLPLVALLVLPLFGRIVAISTALALLVVFLVLCWGVCLRDVVVKRTENRRTRRAISAAQQARQRRNVPSTNERGRDHARI